MPKTENIPTFMEQVCQGRRDELNADKSGRGERPTQTDTCPCLTFPSVLSWKLSTRAARVHLAATRRAAFRRRS